MNILFLSRMFFPHIGGVEVLALELSKRLVKEDFKIFIVTTRYNNNDSSRLKINGINVHRFSQINKKYLGLIYIWIWFVKNIKLIKQADIVHIHDVFIWYLPFRFIYPSKPVYTTFHGWEGVYPIPKKNIFFKRLAAKLSVKNICVGRFIEKYYGIKADKILYTPFEVPKRVKSKKDKRTLLYVGRLDEDTGLLLILKSLSYLRGYDIDFCGDGSLASECKKYGKVHGFVDPKSFYERATIAVSPGYNSVMEALSYKCLVITTYNNPLKRDYLKMTPFAKWIIIRKSPRKMAEDIEYFTHKPEKAKHLINEGYKWMKSQTWEKFAQEYLDLWGV